MLNKRVKEIAAELNKELWLSLTSKELLTEKHCEQIFHLRNEITDYEIPFTMNASNSGKPFSKKDLSLLNELVANIGNIYFVMEEFNQIIANEEFESAEMYSEMVIDALIGNANFGKCYPKGVEYFYSLNSIIYLKSSQWFILENLVLQKTGIVLDLSVNTPEFLRR